MQRAAEHLAEPLWAARDNVVRMLDTQPRHTVLFDCVSHTWSVTLTVTLAVYPRIRVISSFDEHGSNGLCPLAAHQQCGLELHLINMRGDAAQLL